MKTTIEIYSMDSYASFDDAEKSGGIYRTVIDTQEDAFINSVLTAIETTVYCIDSRAQYDYRIIKDTQTV